MGGQHRQERGQRDAGIPQADRQSVSVNTMLSASEWADITGGQVSGIVSVSKPKPRNKDKRVVTPQASDNGLAFGHPKSEGNPEGNPTAYPTARTAVLYTLMLIPAAASIQNMHRVTFDIAGHEFAAVLLTGLFSASPFLFVLAGLKNRLTVALVAFLVLYEAFCNFTRIYGGLTGFGLRGMPTRFLGLVTDVFNSGTHQTAVVLAVIMSLLAASVFYAAYNELRK
jgi:hypothetical protein